MELSSFDLKDCQSSINTLYKRTDYKTHAVSLVYINLILIYLQILDICKLELSIIWRLLSVHAHTINFNLKESYNHILGKNTCKYFFYCIVEIVV